MDSKMMQVGQHQLAKGSEEGIGTYRADDVMFALVIVMLLSQWSLTNHSYNAIVLCFYYMLPQQQVIYRSSW